MGGHNRSEGRRVAYVNARLLDPDSGLDAPGGLLVEGERIADVGAGLFAGGAPDGAAAEAALATGDSKSAKAIARTQAASAPFSDSKPSKANSGFPAARSTHA